MGTETALSTETENAFDPNKIAADVTTTLITEAIKSGWQKVKNFFQDSDAKDSIDYGDAYEDYLKNTVDKNSQIKTLIYPHVPKFLYLFYECPNVQYENKIIETSNAQNILDISNKLIITGTGGIGKSLLLKHIFLHTAQYGYYIPVLIELRKFNQWDVKEISLYEAIYQNLSDNGFRLDKKYFSYSLDAGGYVILLDGFDEVNRDKTQKVFDQIQSFSQRYHKNHFVVSSRPSDRFVGWNDFHELSLCNLTKKQALNLIQKIDFDEAVKKPFSDALDTELFETYESFASNPLLLTIMLLTFSNHATLPRNLNDFYDQAFTTLFNGHDATKDYFVRDIRSGLSCEEFKKVFANICIRSYFAEDFEFTEADLRQYIQKAKEKVDVQSFSVDDFKEDLTSSVCMLVKDGLNYRFIHRSFQEYFAAWYTCKLTDKDQYDLLTNWISKSSSCITDEYMRMLFDFQKEKVNKIIFCPGIKGLKNLYDKYGLSYDLLYTLFSGIRIYNVYPEKDNSNYTRYNLSLTTKNEYLCHIERMVCHLNSYPFLQHNEIDFKTQEIAQKILTALKISAPCKLPFDQVLSVVRLEQLLDSLQWFDCQLHFCFALYERYNKNSKPGKRTIASILDDL